MTPIMTPHTYSRASNGRHEQGTPHPMKRLVEYATGRKADTKALRDTDATKPRAHVPAYMWDTAGRGVPRVDDMLRIRLLERTHAISLPLNLVISQIAGNDWEVVPDEDHKESEKHIKAAKEIADWLMGKYNQNGTSWDHLQTEWARDILSVGTGVIELVWDGEAKRHVSEIYARDGSMFTKSPDKHGILPAPDSGKPAYYEWGGNIYYNAFSYMDTSSRLLEYSNTQSPYLYQYRGITPTPFLRDELMFTERNNCTWDIYGRGIVADAAILAEIVINMTLLNLTYFNENETPAGVMSLKGAGPAEVKHIIDYWESTVRGNPEKFAIIGAPQGVEWQEFRGSAKEMQYLESNQYYTKLCWMLFGLNANEVGDIAEVTRPGGSKQFSVDVWRKTTMPLLSLMQEDINSQLLPRLEPFIRVGGGLVFKYQISHPDADDQMRQRQERDIDLGIVTINQALTERGKPPVRWGDMPRKLIEQLITTQPEWFYEHFIDMEDKPPTPERAPVPGLFGLSAIPETPKAKPPAAPEEKSTAPGSAAPPVTGNDIDPGIEYLFDLPMKAAQAPEDSENRVDEMDEPTPRDFGTTDESPIWHAARTMMARTHKAIADELRRWMDDLEQMWPKTALATAHDATVKRAPLAVPLGEILARLGLAEALRGPIEAGALSVLWAHMQAEGDEVATEVSARVGTPVKFEPRTPDPNSPVVQFLKMRARDAAIQVEADVRDQIGTVLTEAAARGASIGDLTRTLDARVPEISHAKSRLIARTEVMQARRWGAQALADSTDLIGGKRWDATKDDRTRAWHAAMHGVVVPKTGVFTVPRVDPEKQGAAYPKTTYVVGGDQPFNCRCRQRHVLADDMPTDMKSLLSRYPELHVKSA